MKREIKIWGERWLIRQDSTHATSFLKLRKGYECSWHKHREKYNLFVVLWGKVGIEVEQIDGSTTEVVLIHGGCLTTEPGQYHKFKVYESGAMIEEMFVEYSESDIQRVALGRAAGEV